MSIQEAYNYWAETYDSDENLTRDLDQMVTKNVLANLNCKRILEIGCGTGKNTAFLSQIGEKIYAVDFSEGMIRRAKEKLRSDKVSFSVADITKPWPYKQKSIDLIVCNLVLEHIENISFVFREASATLVHEGRFFICEFHPFRQYQGKKARFQIEQKITEIPAFVHNISDFINAAENNGLTLKSLREWWHKEDQDKPPRVISFVFELL